MKNEMYVIQVTKGKETVWETIEWTENLVICVDVDDAYLYIKRYVANNSATDFEIPGPNELYYGKQTVSYDPIDADWAYIEAERLHIWRKEDEEG